MKTYYLTYYPMGWFHVFREGCNNCANEPCDNGLMDGYKEAVMRGHRLKDKNNEVTSIYRYNNSMWFKAEAYNIKEFVDLFFSILMNC